MNSDVLPDSASGMPSGPYLSIVAASRNDGHGGDLLTRTHLFIDGLADQCRRFGLRAELIIVDWNPPPDRPPLNEALKPAERTDSALPMRIITVPQTLHRRFAHSDKLQFFQMIAKNVGIRRAQGEFVLATNVDDLFSDELMSHLATETLSAGRFYRVDRFDVPTAPPTDVSHAERLAWCRDNAFRVARRNGRFLRDPTDPGSEFRRPLALELRRARQQYAEILAHGDAARLKRHGRALANLATSFAERFFGGDNPAIHSKAPGDFTLLARADWEALGGYPEYETFSWNIDGIFLHGAAHRGLSEEAWPPPREIYHIEHSPGSGWSPEAANLLFKRLEDAGIPRITFGEFLDVVERIKSRPREFAFNDAGWGLGGIELETAEFIV